ncbi:aspartate ammonia-lyase [Afipia felis]|uniref:Aspartate ammonia-lyase n=2 Tax=Afipia felis TaxID=1035 RepID=A0A380WE81_AFIFE|nr:aspartate ammonia-lyase [Afipia felis]EKS29683.1 aspartate ammonia-lyase [Afipia felis ATCC 53690]SUU78390.1 Aspartate ammonia-lyase [Afipia felis]SUU86455.1 Aspartate ammonia-lyase [Afipia felis]
MTELYRTEVDFLGEMHLPADTLYGIQTARARENFPITGIPLSQFPVLVNALVMVKKACVLTNRDLDSIDSVRANAIAAACDSILSGAHHEAFVVDMIQGGAGTSTNMNVNEVIANLALNLLERPLGDYRHVHPNDHVNLSQSTNDVYPTAIRLAVLAQCAPLIEAQARLHQTLESKAQDFSTVLKVGRTQLQDAVPMTLGMEFATFAATIKGDIAYVTQQSELLKTVNLGGTAIGTGINAPAGYSELAVDRLSEISGFDLSVAPNLIEATSDVSALVAFSSALKQTAIKLSKICNDLRLLSSGPRAGLGEIRLPAMQPGSSIMPGKVNPVIPEVVNQVAYQVIGNDLTIALAAEAGQLQLNAMEPIMVFNILQSMRIMTQAIKVLTDRCVAGIEANIERCGGMLADTAIVSTALVPLLGYEEAARIAKLAVARNQTVSETVQDLGIMTSARLDEVTRLAYAFSPTLDTRHGKA